MTFILPKIAKDYPRIGIDLIMKADGRKRYRVIGPWQSPKIQRLEKPPTASMVKMTVKHFFEESGCTSHSPMGMFVPYIVAYCHWKGINYSLKAGFVDGRIAGYYMQKLDELGRVDFNRVEVVK